MSMSPDETRMLQEVHRALVGEPHLGNRGLIAEFNDLKTETKKDLESINKKLWYYAGACTGAMAVFGAIFTVIQSFLK